MGAYGQALSMQIGMVQKFFRHSLSVLTEAEAGYSPAAGLFTTAQHVAHAGQTIDWFNDAAFGSKKFDMDFARMDAAVRAYTSLAEAFKLFDAACERLMARLNSVSDEELHAPLADPTIMGPAPVASIVWAITDHTAHHRGALTVYARMNGKVCPMPYE